MSGTWRIGPALALAEDAAGNFRPVAANRLTPEVLA